MSQEYKYQRQVSHVQRVRALTSIQRTVSGPEKYLGLQSLETRTAPPRVDSFMGPAGSEMIPAPGFRDRGPAKKDVSRLIRQRRERVAEDAQALLDQLAGRVPAITEQKDPEPKERQATPPPEEHIEPPPPAEESKQQEAPQQEEEPAPVAPAPQPEPPQPSGAIEAATDEETEEDFDDDEEDFDDEDDEEEYDDSEESSSGDDTSEGEAVEATEHPTVEAAPAPSEAAAEAPPETSTAAEVTVTEDAAPKAAPPALPPKEHTEGWLWKFSVGKSALGSKNWKRRWFVLPVNGPLTYHEESGGKQLGVVIVDSDDSRLVTTPTSKSHPEVPSTIAEHPTNRLLVVCFPEDGKVHRLLLRSESTDDHNRWAQQLRLRVATVNNPYDV